MSIYVNDELKKRMDKVEGVNWSAIACAAFSETVNSREREKKGTTMSKVIERLRLSSESAADKDMVAGRKAGREWAAERATSAQLKRLAKKRDPIHDWYFGVGQSAYECHQRFYFMIEPNDDGDLHAARSFWETELDDEIAQADSTDFVQGFAEGACDLWDEVKQKL